jgi:hypothetical protein
VTPVIPDGAAGAFKQSKVIDGVNNPLFDATP